MPINGFSMTVADMFHYPFSVQVWHEARSGESEMSSHIMTYDITTDLVYISGFAGEQFEDWEGKFSFTIHSGTRTLLELSSINGEIIVPGDVIRSAILEGFTCHVSKQTADKPDTHPWVSRSEPFYP